MKPTEHRIDGKFDIPRGQAGGKAVALTLHRKALCQFFFDVAWRWGWRGHWRSHVRRDTRAPLWYDKW